MLLFFLFSLTLLSFIHEVLISNRRKFLDFQVFSRCIFAQDFQVLLKLACVDTSAQEMVGFINVGLMPLGCFLLILTSYSYIVYSILKIHSAEGRHKAFTTCSAHLTAVLLYFMPVVLIYLRPTTSPCLDAAIQIFNNLVIPMLNPLIYSLRNKEVKGSLKKVLWKVAFLLEKF